MAKKAHPKKKAAKKGRPKPKAAKTKRPKPKATQKARPKPGAGTTQTDVCADNWSGSANENFEWVNGANTPILISQNGNNTFPFVTNPPGRNSITVNPGIQGCQLIGVKSAVPYTYNSGAPCPQLGNPRNVIIS